MKRVFTIFFGAVLIFVCFSAFSACDKTNPMCDVFVKYYCYYTDEDDYEPSLDKYVCTFIVEEDEEAEGELKWRKSGYYFLTYELFYSTGIPFDLNSEEKRIEDSQYIPADKLASETHVRYNYPLDLRLDELCKFQQVQFDLEVKIVP